MNILDIIEKKKNNFELCKEEIDFFINEYINKNILDVQAAALLTTISINGMTSDELFNLINSMINSGKNIDLSKIEGPIVDKHSTGGVGDKTTLIVAPLVASCGVKVAKLSGKGLGYTGGTIDKLESIPGFKTNISINKFIDQVDTIGIALASHTSNFVPADKVLYDLRSVTSNASSIPLIASSIMSKKIASGTDKIVLDVKTGIGALIKDMDSSIKLAKLMVDIGKKFNKQVIAIVTNMDTPLGVSIGNSLEVMEAVEVLKGKGNDDLTKLCLTLAAYMVSIGKNISIDEASKLVKSNLYNKKAYNKFKELVKFQGGNLDDLKVSKNVVKIKSNKAGYINKIDALKLAKVSFELGSGRKGVTDKIDYSVGIVLTKLVGDKINAGDTIALVYHNNNFKDEELVLSSYIIENIKQAKQPLIYGVIQ